MLSIRPLVAASALVAVSALAACDDGSTSGPDAGAEPAVLSAFIDGGLSAGDCQLIGEMPTGDWTGSWGTGDGRVHATTAFHYYRWRLRFFNASVGEPLHGLTAQGSTIGFAYHDVPLYTGEFYKDPGGPSRYSGVPAPTSAGCNRFLGMQSPIEVDERGWTDSAPGIALSNGALVLFYREWLSSSAGDLRVRYLRQDEHGHYVQDRLLARTGP